MGLCRLCLKHRHSDDLIEIFSEHGRRLNVCNTIIKYFSLEIFENDDTSTTICQQCWCRTFDFKQFQSSVKMAQEGSVNNSNDNKDVKSQLIDTSADLLEHSISTVIESVSCSYDDDGKALDSWVVEEIDPLEHSKSIEIESACSDDDAGIDTDTVDSFSNIELETHIKTKKNDNKDVGSHLSDNKDVGTQLIDISDGPDSSVVEEIDLLEHSISTVIESASCSFDDEGKGPDSSIVEEMDLLGHSKSTEIESASCSDNDAGIDTDTVDSFSNIELETHIKTKKHDNKDVGSHLSDSKDVGTQLIDISDGPDSSVVEEIDLLEHSISTVIESASCSFDDEGKGPDSSVVEEMDLLGHSKSTEIESPSCSDNDAGIDTDSFSDIELEKEIKTKKHDNKDVGSQLIKISAGPDINLLAHSIATVIESASCSDDDNKRKGAESSVVDIDSLEQSKSTVIESASCSDDDAKIDTVDSFSDIELETPIKKMKTSPRKDDAIDGPDEDFYYENEQKRFEPSQRDNDRIQSVCKMICTICSKTFQTLDELVRHYPTEHNTKGYVMCCNQKIARLSVLLEHIDFHINPNAFQCDICKGSFSGRYPLKKHMDTHKKNKHHICDFCGKTFKNAANMNNHRNELHLGVIAPKVQCKLCGSWLTEKYYPRHLKLHNTDLATCTVCGKVLQNKKSLGNHMREVHGDRMHRCAVCGKTFSKTLSFREHVAIHTGDDLYKCPYCTKTFRKSAKMHSHRKNIHFQEWERDRGKRLVTAIVP